MRANWGRFAGRMEKKATAITEMRMAMRIKALGFTA